MFTCTILMCIKRTLPKIILTSLSNINKNYMFVIDSSSSEIRKENIVEMEYEISRGLVDFMHTSVPYTIKRLLAADLKSIYVGRGSNTTILKINPFSADYEIIPHERRGGLRVSKQITFNCLVDSDWSDKIACEMSDIEWTCQICDFRKAISTIEKLQHMSTCNQENTEQKSVKSSMPESKKKNAIAYECKECQKILYLAPTEILRHRKQHEK